MSRVRFVMRKAKPKDALTPAQARRLAGLTDDWRCEDDPEWKAGRVFLDLEDRGFCEMESRRVKGGDVLTGPGNTSVYRWFTRRTAAGTAALAALPSGSRGPG